MTDECKLCGGLGEVTITPYGAPDWDADIYGCPCCIERERNEDEVKLKARIAELERQQTVLVEALSKIEKWFGEFPPTGKTWATGEEMSYSAAYGSNGERDFMRSVAREALATVKPAACKNSDSWNCKYCRMTKDCAAIVDPRNYGVPVKPANPCQNVAAPTIGNEVV